MPVSPAKAGLRAQGEEDAAFGPARPDHDHPQRQPSDYLAAATHQQSPAHGGRDVGIWNERGGGDMQ